MKILIIVSEMISISGSPMYNYTLAIELRKQGHEVDLFSRFMNDEKRKNLIRFGVNTIISPLNKIYDLCLISQPHFKELAKNIKCKNLINICHSEFDDETPINGCDKYIAIRPSIKEHLINEHNIPAEKIEVIYNGVDFERFNPSKRKKHDGDYTKIVLPCSINARRENLIRHYIDKSSEKNRVFIYGINRMRDLNLGEWVTVLNPDLYLENHIGDADIVAGILLGRINLEARAMGIPSIIHDAFDANQFHTFEISDEDFNQRHDIKNVAQQILSLC